MVYAVGDMSTCHHILVGDQHRQSHILTPYSLHILTPYSLGATGVHHVDRCRHHQPPPTLPVQVRGLIVEEAAYLAFLAMCASHMRSLPTLNLPVFSVPCLSASSVSSLGLRVSGLASSTAASAMVGHRCSTYAQRSMAPWIDTRPLSSHTVNVPKTNHRLTRLTLVGYYWLVNVRQASSLSSYLADSSSSGFLQVRALTKSRTCLLRNGGRRYSLASRHQDIV